MAGLEDLSEYIGIVKQEAAENNEEAIRLQAKTDAEERDDLARRSAAIHIGSQAANILINSNIPTEKIWDTVEIGKTKPITTYNKFADKFTYPRPIHALQNNRNGWKIMTKKKREGDGDSYGIPAIHYSLDENGILQRYSTTHVRNYKPSHYSEAYSADGIIQPVDLNIYDLEQLTSSEMFKKAVASLVAGLGTYRY